jgi:hypothetical protein
MPAKPEGDFTAVAQGMAEATEAALAAGFGPAVAGEPGGCLKLSEQDGIRLAVCQHVYMLTSLAESCSDVADVDRPVAGAGLEGFLWENKFQWDKAIILIWDIAPRNDEEAQLIDGSLSSI